MTDAGVLLEGKKLGWSVDAIDILRDVDITVREGELVGLIGPNGAGKSTLLRLLTHVEQSGEGEVFLKGKSIKQVSAQVRAREMGYLVQGAKASWPFSVERVVGLGRLPHQNWWQRINSEDQKKIETALQLTETIAYRNRMVNTLSGGEQTLVMLARIFAGEPELILADEPVAALDPYHQLHVMDILRNHAQGNKAGVVVLHDLGLAARYCDRLYLLNHGKLFCSGTPEKVLTDEILGEVYGIECQIGHTDGDFSITALARKQDYHP